ncbi:hypothetical protein ILUMI_13353 [Ignelater luminosus]|uniref:Uncharacterized protein n=1 Tax=Ignelater luminosus TaxID=2038154 RepID=A0A8K0CYQ8_IGNLU|nr:hypothetical protein ILUMI_13353 [Ignelater luminosus]
MVRYRTPKNQNINTIKASCSMCTQVGKCDTTKEADSRTTQPYVVIQKLEDQLPQLKIKPVPNSKIVLVRKNVNFKSDEKPRYTIIRRITGGMSTTASYNTFVQPISNNKNVNSTLDDIITEQSHPPLPQHKDNVTVRKTLSQEKTKLKRKYYKAGPKCFKVKWMKLQDDGNKTLDTETIVNLQKRDIAVQTEEDNEDCVNNGINMQESDSEGDEIVLNNFNNDQVKYSSYANFTAIVASRHQDNTGSSSTFSLDDDIQPESTADGSTATKQKYIQITAKTVHIHNHFFD